MTQADPWAVDSATSERGRARPQWTALVAVWGLGVAATFARVAPRNASTHRWAIALAVCALIFELFLRCAPRRSVRLTGTAAALLGASLVSHFGLGPIAVGVAFVSLVVADAALISWHPWPAHPVRATPAAALAIPFLVVAQAGWYRAGDIGDTLTLLMASMVTVELYSWTPDLVRRIDEPVERGVRTLGRWVASIIMFGVAVPLLYVPGALVGAAGARGRRRSRQLSAWREITLGIDRQRNDAPYPFASSEPRDVRRRLAAGLVTSAVLAGSMVLVVRAEQPARATRPSLTEPASRSGRSPGPPAVFGQEFNVKYSALPAYAGTAWADDLQAEQAKVPMEGDYSGTYFTVRDGRRVTAEPRPCASCRKAEVWLTGGSSVWGIGQRDHHTIASNLVRLAERHGRRLRVDNMGIRGSVFAAQVDAVERRLRSEAPPDVIVFDNGFNDVGVELAGQMAATGDPTDRRLVAGSLQELDANKVADPAELQRRADAYRRLDFGGKAARATAKSYREQQRRMDELARRHHLRVIYMFQPDALASHHQLEPYEAISHVPTDAMAASPLGVGLAGAAAALRTRVINLRPIYDDEPQQVFLGLVHQNEDGAALEAAAILPHVLDAVRASGS